MIEEFLSFELFLKIREKFFYFFIFLIVIVLSSLNYYTGSVKKLDMIIQDLKKNSFVSKNTMLYNKYGNNNTSSLFDITLISHLFFVIPSELKYPSYYQNDVFLKQLRKVKNYRKFYEISFSIISGISLIIIVLILLC